METKEIINQHIIIRAQDNSSFILLHEHSKVFRIIFTNCPGNVCLGNVCPGKWLSRKHLVPEIIDESGHADVRETSFRESDCPERSCPGNVLSGKRLVPETSVRESDCPGNVLSGKRLVRESSCPGIVLSGKGLVRETSVRESDCPGNVRYPFSFFLSNMTRF